MFQIDILDKSDIVVGTDYCRPLYMSTDDDGNTREFSPYSGSPINNMKWVRADKIFHKSYFGNTAEYICRELDTQYEFARGVLPSSHILRGRHT